ncbi:RNA lariat debranching enzyme [Phaffia rhodozyma]|uniref:RNA lariat debranching enzyme n=1 Tax=Phaffia rhodozyma TaxID=264483 RepID=A0A0F7SQR8_PHARH|nr:RNA lariat debranching enzyme [Phaffia rhodozyma]
MHIAIEGCCHGELDAIYASIHKAEREKGIKVDLLLICGDFQALRNPHDFESLAVPQKFRNLGSFHSYYSGQKVAPLLTIVIGGNHEASNYMWELYHGGWLAPNIYYLGTSGSVLVNGIRISGASGIFKSHDYRKGFFETVPFDRSTLRSVYHIRHHSVSKLLLLPPTPSPSSSSSSQIPHIFLSHDWPLTISKHGDLPTLLRRKPFFQQEIEENTLGSPPLLELLQRLRPAYWFSAHLHVKFAAVWKHLESAVSEQLRAELPTEISIQSAAGVEGNPDEILLDEDEDDVDAKEEANVNILLLLPSSSTTINPDEILLDDDDDDDLRDGQTPYVTPPSAPTPIHVPLSDIDEASTKSTLAELAEVSEGQPGLSANPDEILLDDGDDDDEEPEQGQGHVNYRSPKESEEREVEVVRLDERPDLVAQTGSSKDYVTKFLALDKCLPNKDFLQILEIPTASARPDTPLSFTFDPDWLAITRAMHPFLSLQPHPSVRIPSESDLRLLVEKEARWVESNGLGWVKDEEEKNVRGKAEVGSWQKFWKTAPAVDEPGGGPAAWYTNPQTLAFCTMLQIENKINPVPAGFEAPPLPFEIPSSSATTADYQAEQEGGMFGVYEDIHKNV